MPLAVFLFGLCLGSFLNVCIHRLPKGESVVRPRSRCPGCAHPIAAYDNIPLVSFLLLGGRCRHCRVRISPLYPLVELLTGVTLALTYLRFGFSPLGLKTALLAAALIVLFFTDLRDRMLPDRVTYPGIAAGVLFALWLPVEDGTSLLLLRALGAGPLSPVLLSLADGLLGALFAAGMLLLVRELYFWWRGREGMGLGDVKMMTMLGAFLGPKQVVLIVLFASLLGSMISVPIFLIWIVRATITRRFAKIRLRLGGGRRKPVSRFRFALVKTGRTAIPFGVFLSVVGLVALFWGRPLVAAYLRLLP